MLLVMLFTLLMFAVQEVLSTTFASRTYHTQHGALLHLRGGAGASTRLYIHDGLTAGSRCHMNTNLVESPEWKVLRDAVSLYVSAAAADRNANPKSGSIEAAEKLISNHLRIMLDVTNPFAPATCQRSQHDRSLTAGHCTPAACQASEWPCPRSASAGASR